VDFSQAEGIVISSYPRSGNTLLRTILFQCFGLYSASAHPRDLGENAELEHYVGHLRNDADWPADSRPMLWKRHDLVEYSGPTIYVLRNGRDAIRSLYRFYRGDICLDRIIRGETVFGTWADHVRFWFAREHGQTLLLRYEDLAGNLPKTLDILSRTLGKPVLNPVLPNREEIVRVDNRWVRAAADRPVTLSPGQDQLFRQINGEVMEKLGYA